jgi:aspartyl aminopeptidase
MAGLINGQGEQFTDDFLNFINEACTAFHAVDACKTRLLAAGFVYLSEDEEWTLAPGGKYFFTRNSTTLVTFFVGAEYNSGNGFTVLGNNFTIFLFNLIESIIIYIYIYI